MLSKRWIFVLAGALALASCAQSANVIPPSALALVTGQAKRVTPKALLAITIRVPHRRRSRRARYISPSTQSVLFSVYNASGTTLLASTALNVTPTTNGCKPVSAATQCTETVRTPPGHDTLDVTTYDQQGEKGSALSALRSYPITVATGKANHVGITLGGLAASFSVSVQTSPQISYSTSSGLSIVGNAPQSITIKALDADGNVIAGTGAPTPVVIATPANTTIAATGTSAYTLTSTFTTATSPITPATTTLQVQATPVPNSGGTTVTKGIPLSLYQPWIYVIGESSTTSTLYAFDEAGNAKTLSNTTLAKYAYFPIYSPATQLLYISNCVTGTPVVAYDLAGTEHTSFGSIACGGQEAIDNNGLLYVADWLTSSSGTAVQVFNTSGTQQTFSGTPFNDSGMTGWALAYDPTNDVVYLGDFSAGTITPFNTQGVAQSTPGSFPSPADIDGMAFDPQNGFLYSATGETAITAYDTSGDVQSLSGSWSGIDGPASITYDPYNDSLYVSNATGANLTKYDAQGNQQTLGGSAFSGVTNAWGAVVVP